MELCWQPDPGTIYSDLADWTWLPGLTDLRPVLVTVFADVILQGPDGYWWLDTMEGNLSCEWGSADELNQALATPEGQDTYLLGGLAHGAQARGLERAPGQVYVFAPPPVLSGSFDLANVMAMDLTVALSLSGQLHRQLRERAPASRSPT